MMERQELVPMRRAGKVRNAKWREEEERGGGHPVSDPRPVMKEWDGAAGGGR